MKKRDYNVIAGESHAVEAHTSTVVTSQPTGQSGTENYVLDLDAQQVASKLCLLYHLTTPIHIANGARKVPARSFKL